MADIALRSPQFKYKPIPATGVLSTVCTVTVDGTTRYTLIKNVAASTTVNFEISELARDYLEIEYKSSFIAQYVNIVTVLTNYAGLNGTGAVVGTATTFTDKGYESYGTFEEGVNPSFIGDRANPTVLIAQDNVTNSSTQPTFTILTPTGKGGKVAYTLSNTSPASVTYSAGATSFNTGSGTLINIKRIDCTKYGLGRKIIFINKFGAQQELWFFLKRVKSLGRKNEGYKSNTITYPTTDNSATYSINDAANKVFNTQAKQSHVLSSGYYPEFANEFFEQLLLSEYVWMERLKKGTETVEVIPVKVTSSSMTFKTSVNDRLIEYNMNFEEAFDYINNIR
jgi:hypothetical protein